LAQYDDETIVVYQAYRPEIATFAVEHQHFGGGFSYGRMSWVKPNFLWMMYRSDWGRAEGQEVVLAVRLRRAFFDELLNRAVPSSFHASGYASEAAWRDAVRVSDVRLQWDPDHLPSGEPCARRALQLGLRGASLTAYGRNEAQEIIDVSEFVAEQRAAVHSPHEKLLTPVERVYVPADPALAVRLGLGNALG
jgi:hypothetical protein